MHELRPPPIEWGRPWIRKGNRREDDGREPEGRRRERGRLTPTERAILAYVSEREGEPCTKAQIAEALGRNRKTIDLLIARLRTDGLIVSEPTWADNGGQLANVYRLGRERSS